MKKWLALALVVLLAVMGYGIAGPFLAMQGIRAAVEERDMAALDRHVDFPAVRRSLRLQIEDTLARRAGADGQEGLLEAIGLKAASMAASTAADAVASPAGIAAVLEGRSVVRRIAGGGSRDAFADVEPEQLLDDAEYGFESPSRFTATVRNADGHPVVFVLTRQGLRWRVTDVRVPFAAILGLPAER